MVVVAVPTASCSVVGNSQFCTSGNIQPRSEGPITTPATISLTTWVWPKKRPCTCSAADGKDDWLEEKLDDEVEVGQTCTSKRE